MLTFSTLLLLGLISGLRLHLAAFFPVLVTTVATLLWTDGILAAGIALLGLQLGYAGGIGLQARRPLPARASGRPAPAGR